MRVYISGRITGLPRDEARATFARAAENLKQDGHEPVDPFAIPHPAGCGCPAPVDGSHAWACCLRKDIRVLIDCDAIYMLPGWENSQGARLELHTASALGLDVWRAAPSVLNEVVAERVAQDAKWGEQNHPDGTGEPDQAAIAKRARENTEAAAHFGWLTWVHILDEEVKEAFAESDPAKLRAELIQVAAVAVAWAEAIDRRQRDA